MVAVWEELLRKVRSNAAVVSQCEESQSAPSVLVTLSRVDGQDCCVIALFVYHTGESMSGVSRHWCNIIIILWDECCFKRNETVFQISL